MRLLDMCHILERLCLDSSLQGMDFTTPQPLSVSQTGPFDLLVFPDLVYF